MTIDELERDLPWGFHDADLRCYQVDLVNRTAWFDFDLPIDDHQQTTRAGRLELRGVFCVTVAPPLQVSLGATLQVDSLPWQREEDVPPLPPIPERCFLHTFWRHGTSSAINIVAEDASFAWTGDTGPSDERRSIVTWPGEELP